MNKSIAIFICIQLLFIACSAEQEDRSVFLKREFEKRKVDYTSDEIAECKAELINTISYEVDSLMFYLVEKMKGNSNEMPARPDRPSRLVDTIELESLNEK